MLPDGAHKFPECQPLGAVPSAYSVLNKERFPSLLHGPQNITLSVFAGQT